MKVTVKLFSAFRGPPVAEIRSVELLDGTRVQQVLSYFQVHPELMRIVPIGTLIMVNQRRSDLMTILQDGDEVSVFDIPGG